MFKILILSLLTFSLHASETSTIAFYNVENMFDHIDDADVDDREFTPNGTNSWTKEKSLKKIKNIASVLQKMRADVVGLAEVENLNVLELLISMNELKSLNYKIVHFDSPDKRGIDVALLYRADVFEVESSEAITFEMSGLKPTRDILKVKGNLKGESVLLYVNHWPSRSGGQAASEKFRKGAAKLLKDNYLAEKQTDLNTKVIMMGDFNDDPTNTSLKTVLGAKATKAAVKENGIYNPYHAFFKRGEGTSAYQDAWNNFDQIFVSDSLLKAHSGLTFSKARIYRASFLIQSSGRYRGYPLRTMVDGQIGYSDHLPVIIELKNDSISSLKCGSRHCAN